MAEIEQNTIDETVASGRELIRLCKHIPTESMSPEDYRTWWQTVSTHKVMLDELAGEL